MNDQPKTKFYKRPWFLLVAGMIIGPVLVGLALLAYVNRDQIGSLPVARDARNATISASKKSVRLSNCAADPASVQLAASDYVEQRGATITLINLDSERHKIAEAGAMGEVVLSPNGTQDISYGSQKDGTFTCDGKESFTIKAPSASQFQEFQRAENIQVRSQWFNYLPVGVKNCASSVLGPADLQNLLAANLKIQPDEQAKLSMCIYGTLSADAKKCVADLAGGEQNLESMFRNLPASIECYGQSAECDKANQDSQKLNECISGQYTSLFHLTNITKTIGSPPQQK